MATMAAATDPRTGAIDLDSINVGTSTEERMAIQARANAMLAVVRDYNRSNIRASALLDKYNNAQQTDSDKITMGDLRKIVQRLEQNEKLRAGDWLQDDPMIAIIDRSDM